MNAQRRNEITKLIECLENLASDVRAVAEEEQEYYDNMPESLQGGEKGEAAEAAAQCLEDAAGELEEIVNQLEEAKQ